jgi:DNA-binding GntR family transcriptional regulator
MTDFNTDTFSIGGTRAAAIAAELRRLIQTGELPAGARLRQAEIAERFGVSTTPVREAFTALAREGVVRQDAHRGVVVFTPQLADLRENYLIRGALESLASEKAAEKIGDEDLARLDSLLERMGREKNASRYQDLNRRFHATIYAAADRPRLAELIESLRDASEAYLRLLASRPPRDEYLAQGHAEHQAIAQALASHDGAAANRLVAEHLEHNLRELEAVVAADGARETVLS